MTRIWLEEATGQTKDAAGLRDMGSGHAYRDVTDRPAPSVLAGCPVGIVVEPGGPDVQPHDKPPYRIPDTADIIGGPLTGYVAASTFSGCGGSCLGHRWAGFDVRYANEFVEESRRSYAANFTSTHLDPRDVRQVRGEEICELAGVAVGGLDLLDGSPPCQSFSTAGKREAGWGQVHAHGDGSVQVSDDLFFEYARLLREARPRAFVAENVSGLVKGTAKGYFLDILRALRASGYKVEARLLDAQWLGVPQARQRLIFVGIRDDLGAAPRFPTPMPYRYTVRDALPHIADPVRYQYGPRAEPRHGDPDEPAGTVMAKGIGGVREYQATVPGDGQTEDPETGERLAPFARVVHDTGSPSWSTGDVTDRPCPTVTIGTASMNSYHYQVHGDDGPATDPETGAKIALGKAVGEEWDRLPVGGQSERYFQLVRQDPDKPSGTVTAAGGNVGLASVAHPTQRRKFTIAELRRICGFPDDYRLEGTYGQRWARLGNAVPPPMMRAVSAAVRDVLLEVDGR